MSINPRKPRVLAGNTSGQALSEFLIALVLVVIPALIAGGRLLQADWKKTQCAYVAFQNARAELIRSAAPVSLRLKCGSEEERLSLTTLEELDHDKGGVDLEDLGGEVSQYWEEFSSLRSRLSPSASFESALPSGEPSTGRSGSTGTAGALPSDSGPG